MKRVSGAWPLKAMMMLSVAAAALGGCNADSGGKDAGDFCEDTCAVFLACDDCRDVDPFDLIPNDRDDCITYFAYNELRIRRLAELESYCNSLCNEINGEVEAVGPSCADAIADFWECLSDVATCDELELLPLIEDPGGVYLPAFTDCDEEAAVATEACEDDVP